MIIEIDKNTIEAIKGNFLFYGFLKSPLSDKEIVRLLAKGFTEGDVHGIGCDIACEAFSDIEEASRYYLGA